MWRLVRVCLSVIPLLTSLAATGCTDEQAAIGGVKVRVIEMTMTEMAFAPDDVTVTVGETVTFRLTNAGTVRHEAVFGDQSMQNEAVAQMQAMGTTTSLPPVRGRSFTVRAHPGMGLPNLISLEPGQSGDITFTFGRAANFLIQCHEDGHLEGGMTATLRILAG